MHWELLGADALLRRWIWDRLASKSLPDDLRRGCVYSAMIPPLLSSEDPRIQQTTQDDDTFLRPQPEYIYQLQERTFIEPDYGFVIKPPCTLISLSLANSTISRQGLSVFSGVPGLPRYARARLGAFPVRRMPSVILLRWIVEDNYYHCYTDLLSRLMMLDEFGIDRELPILISSRLARQPYFQAMIRRGALAQRQWIVQDGFYVEAEQVVFARAATGNVERIRRLMRAIDAPAADPAGQRRLFLYRGGGAQQLRELSNLQELLPVLEQYGFTAVDSGALPLEEQMELFSQARCLVGIHGAGITNMFYRQGQPLALLELFPPGEQPLFYYAWSRALGHHYDCLTGTDAVKIIDAADPSRRGWRFKIEPDVLSLRLQRLLNEISTS